MMEEQICDWKYCRTKILVDTSLGGGNSVFTVVGWCDVHKLAYSIYTEMEKRFAKRNHLSWPIGSLSYQKNKKAFDELHVLAGHRAKEQMKK